MASQLETAIAQFREQLLQNDAATLKQITTSYADVRARLVKRIGELEAAMESGDVPATGKVFQWDRAQALLKQVEAEMASLGLRSQGPIVAGQEAAVAMAGEHAVGLATATAATTGDTALAGQIATSWNRLNTGAVEAMTGRLSDGSPLSSWLGQFGNDASSLIKDELTRAIALGENPRAVARRLEKQVDVSAARLLMTTRTAQLNAYRDASLQSFAANDDILSGWIWTSSHSSRTCMACLALDGQEFTLKETFMKSHVCCRCSPRPSIIGLDDPAVETGAEWFARQPDKVKRSMVPLSAGDDVVAGRLQPRDFVHLRKDDQWGDQYQQGSVAHARANARARGVTFPGKAATSGPVTIAKGAKQPTVAPLPPWTTEGDPKATGTVTIPASASVVPKTKPRPPATVALEQTATPIEIPKAAPAKPTPTAKTAPLSPTKDINPEYTMDDVFDGKPIAEYRGSKTTAANGLTDAELSAIRDYSGEGYDAINGALRSGKPLFSGGRIDTIDAAMSRSELDAETTVYRGVTIDVFGDLSNSIGTTFTDNGYVSTTTTRAIAEGFARGGTLGDGPGVLLKVTLPRGTNAVDVNAINPKSIEREILLPRGSSFRVVSVNTEVSPPVVDLEVIE